MSRLLRQEGAVSDFQKRNFYISWNVFLQPHLYSISHVRNMEFTGSSRDLILHFAAHALSVVCLVRIKAEFSLLIQATFNFSVKREPVN